MRTSAFSACLNTIATWIVRDGHRKALRELVEEGRLRLPLHRGRHARS
jgi:hypothetical protein